MRPSFLALVLHAHLPFVRHPEHEEFFEEDWLFEAISETYIPLTAMMQRLVRDGVPFKLSLSITPPLCAMLQDELLRGRYLRAAPGEAATIRRSPARLRKSREERVARGGARRNSRHESALSPAC